MLTWCAGVLCETGPLGDKWTCWPGGTSGRCIIVLRDVVDSYLFRMHTFHVTSHCIIGPTGSSVNKHTYLDFQKAFDNVPHQRLILKLKSHGMGNSIINWIEQWLNDRRQRVVVDGEVSSWNPVLSGVPQGSVLGPILFFIYINDLEEGVTGNILKFADDTKLFRKTKGIGDIQKLQDDIDKLVRWSETWQMLFNFGKCKCLHTGPGNTGMNYEMGGTILNKTVKEKDLRGLNEC